MSVGKPVLLCFKGALSSRSHAYSISPRVHEPISECTFYHLEDTFSILSTSLICSLALSIRGTVEASSFPLLLPFSVVFYSHTVVFASTSHCPCLFLPLVCAPLYMCGLLSFSTNHRAPLAAWVWRCLCRSLLLSSAIL